MIAQKVNCRENTKKIDIKDLVNGQLVEALKLKGYEETVAQKAVLLSGNKTEEDALNWINEHKNDPDFNEPVVIGKVEDQIFSQNHDYPSLLSYIAKPQISKTKRPKRKKRSPKSPKKRLVSRL